MYSTLIILLTFSCKYIILLDAAKVIKWADLEISEAPLPEDKTTTEFKEKDNVDVLNDMDINQPINATIEKKELKEDLAIRNKRDKLSVSKIESSYPTCLTNFVGSLIYDLMQNENGRIIVSAYLNAFTQTTSNSISSNMYLHISRQFKNLLKDPKGSQSISIISSTVTKVLTSERAVTKLNTAVESFKMTFVQPEMTLYVENLSELVTSITIRPKSRRIFRALSDGFLSLFKLSDPKNAIIKGFQDLRTYTWPNVASQ